MIREVKTKVFYKALKPLQPSKVQQRSSTDFGQTFRFGFLPWGLWVMVFVSVCWAGNSRLTAQNLYISVLDQATYRGVPGVSVQLVSDLATINLQTSPQGEVSENIPAGTYSITLQRAGYQTQRKDRIVVHSHERTQLEIWLQPTQVSTSDDPSRPTAVSSQTTSSDEKPVRELIDYSREIPRFFGELGMFSGPLKGWQLTGGWFALRNFYILASLGYSSNSYASFYFTSPGLYSLNFYSLATGGGAEISRPVNNQFGLFVNSSFAAGVELVSASEIISAEDVNALMVLFLKPSTAFGLYYGRLALYAGYSYAFWVSRVMSQKGIGVYSQENEQPLKWGDDMFPGRKGLGLYFGLRFYF